MLALESIPSLPLDPGCCDDPLHVVGRVRILHSVVDLRGLDKRNYTAGRN